MAVTLSMLPSERFAAVQHQAKLKADEILKDKGLGVKALARTAQMLGGVAGIAAGPVGAVADILKFNRGSLKTYGSFFEKALVIAGCTALAIGVLSTSPMTSVFVLAWGAGMSLGLSPLAIAMPNTVRGAGNWAYAKVASKFAHKDAPLRVDTADFTDAPSARRVGNPSGRRGVELEDEPRFFEEPQVAARPEPGSPEDMNQRLGELLSLPPDQRFAHGVRVGNAARETNRLRGDESDARGDAYADTQPAELDQREPIEPTFEPREVRGAEQVPSAAVVADVPVADEHLVRGRGYTIDMTR